MKLTVLAFFFSLSTLGLFAQPLCLPDSLAIDTFISGFGVSPLPFDPEDFPQGGFRDTACFENYFETVVQVAVADTAMVAGNQIVLDSVVLTDIDNLPAGLTYECSTPDCKVFPNSFICATIYGTPTDPTDIGSNILTISATVYTSGFVLAVNYPDPALNQTGSYDLVVQNAADCTTNTRDLGTVVSALRNTPNPFQDRTQLQFELAEPGLLRLRVTDAFGRQQFVQQGELPAGAHTIDLETGDWANGIYLYTLERDGATISGRMLLSR